MTQTFELSEKAFRSAQSILAQHNVRGLRPEQIEAFVEELLMRVAGIDTKDKKTAREVVGSVITNMASKLAA